MTREDVDQICDELRNLQSYRKSCVRATTALGNAQFAMARKRLHWSPTLPPKERNRINREAQDLVTFVVATGEREGGDFEEDLMWKYILLLERTLHPFKKQRIEWEKAMTLLARKLPVFPWWDSIRGTGALGLAIIVGEAGNLSN